VLVCVRAQVHLEATHGARPATEGGFYLLATYLLSVNIYIFFYFYHHATCFLPIQIISSTTSKLYYIISSTTTYFGAYYLNTL